MSELAERHETQLSIPGVVTETGLELPPDLTYDEWESVGRTLQRIERSVMWWVGDWLRYGERRYGETYSQALSTTDYAYQTLANAAYVAERVESSRRRENLSWSHHAEIAALEPDEQERFLEKAEANDWNRDEFRKVVREERRPTLGMVQPPAGTFELIYADPPWRYDFSRSPSRDIENQYPTMELEDIKALDVPAADDAILFLWATSPKLPEAFEVMDAWGFEYRTSMVWVKPQIGMGYYCRSKHELLLIGKRGEAPIPEETNRPHSVLEAPRTTHSTKPSEFYEVIERMYPSLTKVELFARAERDGWASWGGVAIAS